MTRGVGRRARLLREEGPKYQYGEGCMGDGVICTWHVLVCGIGRIFEHDKVVSHLRSVYRYNFAADLSRHANPHRSEYALGDGGGLLRCTWPNGGRPSLPFPYSDEV